MTHGPAPHSQRQPNVVGRLNGVAATWKDDGVASTFFDLEGFSADSGKRVKPGLHFWSVKWLPPAFLSSERTANVDEARGTLWPTLGSSGWPHPEDELFLFCSWRGVVAPRAPTQAAGFAQCALRDRQVQQVSIHAREDTEVGTKGQRESHAGGVLTIAGRLGWARPKYSSQKQSSAWIAPPHSTTRGFGIVGMIDARTAAEAAGGERAVPLPYWMEWSPRGSLLLG